VKNALGLVRVMGEVAGIANDSDTLTDAVGRSLRCLCVSGDWDVGHAYLAARGSGALESGGIWVGGIDSPSFLEFKEASVNQALEPGVGWLGSVLEVGHPVWVVEVDREVGFRRSEAAARAGLVSGLSFPILADAKIVGIIELFSITRRESDPLVTEFLIHIGRILGSVYQREEGRNELNASLRRFKALFGLLPLPAAVASYPEGRYVEVNRRFEEVFGWMREEILGRTEADLCLWSNPEDRDGLLAYVPRAPDFLASEVSLQGRGGRPVVGLVTVTRISWDGAPHVLGMLLDLTERMETERLLEKRREEVEFLIERLLGLQEEERSRLARELHDGIGQTLTALKLKIGALEVAAPDVRVELGREALRILDDALEGARSLSFDLRPAMLDELGLENAVRAYVSRQGAAAGLAVELQVAESLERRSRDVQTACYRILQEAVTNVIRHARATSIRVELAEGPDGVVLGVRDDGVGFCPEHRNGHLGLMIMSERAELVGGTVEVTSSTGSGTTVTARLPGKDVRS